MTFQMNDSHNRKMISLKPI